jgi:hypothetical protein
MSQAAQHRFGLWTPHRDSHNILALKSLLGFRSENWHWCESQHEAQWWLVDASYPIEAKWTLHLRHHAQTRGIILAQSFTESPDPIWQFVKTPLNVGRINAWLNQLVQTTISPTPPALTPMEVLPLLSNLECRLSRWPNLTRYGELAIKLTPICEQWLRDWHTAERVVIKAGSNITQSDEFWQLFLQDVQAEGILQTRLTIKGLKPHIHSPTALTEPTQLNPKSLLQRLWERFV